MPARPFAEPCSLPEREAALDVLFGEMPFPDRKRQVDDFLAAARRGDLDLSGLIVVHDRDRIVGTLLAIESPGRTVLTWPPVFAEGVLAEERTSLATLLFHGVLHFANARAARLCQALIGVNELWLEPLLAPLGYEPLARLIYLKRDLADSADPEEIAASDVELVTFERASVADLASVLDQTYQQSLDCPELTGVRSLEEIIDSHRAQGLHDPRRWFLARRRDEWVGCLLLANMPDMESIELAYVGVVPSARGQGLGRILTRRAIAEGRRSSVKWVTLAVDERNHPARKLYEDEGFTPWEERVAWLRLIRPADGRPVPAIP